MTQGVAYITAGGEEAVISTPIELTKLLDIIIENDFQANLSYKNFTGAFVK